MLIPDECLRRALNQASNAHANARRIGALSTLTDGEWLAILRASEGQCHYCGRGVGVAALELEHVLALANGGHNTKENVVAACTPCNRKKSYDHARLRQQTAKQAC